MTNKPKTTAQYVDERISKNPEIKGLKDRLHNIESALIACLDVVNQYMPPSGEGQISEIMEGFFVNSEKLGAFKSTGFKGGE